jgi:hypothetical protein
MINSVIEYLSLHPGHYLHGLILFSDDLKEALQKLDNFRKEMKTIMNTNTYTLVHVRELFPPCKPCPPDRIFRSSRRETHPADDNIVDPQNDLPNLYVSGKLVKSTT